MRNPAGAAGSSRGMPAAQSVAMDAKGSAATTSVAQPVAGAADDELELQRALARLGEHRLRPRAIAPLPQEDLAEEFRIRLLENAFLKRERQAVAPLVHLAPVTDPGAFIGWFEGLRANGPGQGHPLFPWLAQAATLDQMRWFLAQEVAGEAGFEDLVALTQVKMPVQAKLELGRNFWDELGRGMPSGMHGPMLKRVADALALDPNAEPVTEALALAN